MTMSPSVFVFHYLQCFDQRLTFKCSVVPRNGTSLPPLCLNPLKMPKTPFAVSNIANLPGDRDAFPCFKTANNTDIVNRLQVTFNPEDVENAGKNRGNDVSDNNDTALMQEAIDGHWRGLRNLSSRNDSFSAKKPSSKFENSSQHNAYSQPAKFLRSRASFV